MSPDRPTATPTDQEGRWLAAFDSGRWVARSIFGRWSATSTEWQAEPDDVQDPRDLLPELYTGEEDELPEPVQAAIALHHADWMNTAGELTTLGRAALTRWAAGA